MVLNGGQWLLHPTYRGTLFIQAWLALMYKDLVVDGRMWNGTGQMDQVGGGGCIGVGGGPRSGRECLGADDRCARASLGSRTGSAGNNRYSLLGYEANSSFSPQMSRKVPAFIRLCRPG